MNQFEQPEKDELSKEAHELFSADRERKVSELQDLFHVSQTHKHLLEFIDKGILTSRMTIDEALARLEKYAEEVHDEFEKEED